MIDAIATTSPEFIYRAEVLAEKLSLPIKAFDTTANQLLVTEEGLKIHTSLGNPFHIDFGTGKYDHQRKFGGGRGREIARAVGLTKGRTPTIVDATAGFAKDAFVFASLGCQLTLIEQNPFIALLLDDALQRAHSDGEISDITNRMNLITGNAIEHLSKLPQVPDVIYLDPMYPERNKSALVKKEMQLLHQLVGVDTDSDKLLKIARNIARQRVVVKRPKGAPTVDEQTPSATVESKNTRYDIYL